MSLSSNSAESTQSPRLGLCSDMFFVRYSLRCVGPICVSDRLIELARREVISPPLDPVVEVVAGRQRRLQQVTAEQFLDQQGRDIALSCRIVRRPLAGCR
nr:hypothetical protein [Bradyrhizobium guangzhouense]